MKSNGQHKRSESVIDEVRGLNKAARCHLAFNAVASNFFNAYVNARLAIVKTVKTFNEFRKLNFDALNASRCANGDYNFASVIRNVVLKLRTFVVKFTRLVWPVVNRSSAKCANPGWLSCFCMKLHVSRPLKNIRSERVLWAELLNWLKRKTFSGFRFERHPSPVVPDIQVNVLQLFFSGHALIKPRLVSFSNLIFLPGNPRFEGGLN